MSFLLLTSWSWRPLVSLACGSLCALCPACVKFSLMSVNGRAAVFYSDCFCPRKIKRSCFIVGDDVPKTERGQNKQFQPPTVMWVILRKGHSQIYPAVCINILTSLLFVHFLSPHSLFCMASQFHFVICPQLLPAMFDE